jgi:signal peptidase I
VNAPAFPSRIDDVPGSSRQKVTRLVGAVVVTAAASVILLRQVWPSSLEGANGGLTGFLGWLGEAHPLMLGVGLFVVLSETGRYWSRRRGVARGAPDGTAVGTRDGATESSTKRSTRRLVLGLGLVAVAVFLVRSSIAATYRVVGPSMLPTLEMGDRVLVNRASYGLRLPFSKHLLRAKVPQRGDLVVFPLAGLPGTTGPQAAVKRVLGVPGDTVSFERGTVIINGWTVPSCDAGPYVDLTGGLTVRGRLVLEYLGDRTYLTVRKPIEQPFPGYTVKPGEVFVIGDDRGMSTDSRVWSEGHGGGVPIDALEGKVTRVLLGAQPDGRLDLSRLLAPPLDLKVRLPGLDMRLTDRRISDCLGRRPVATWPPAPRAI